MPQEPWALKPLHWLTTAPGMFPQVSVTPPLIVSEGCPASLPVALAGIHHAHFLPLLPVLCSEDSMDPFPVAVW